MMRISTHYSELRNISGHAEFSHCGNYRYRLSRVWELHRPCVVFALLNPSTADAEMDDPTIRRCMTFAKQWGYGRLEIVNLFGLRSTDPKTLASADDPFGPENEIGWWRAVSDMNSFNKVASERGLMIPSDNMMCFRVVCAWGTHGGLHDADLHAYQWIENFDMKAEPFCLGTTKHGFPRHPLYLPKDTMLQPHEPRTRP